MSDLKLTQDFQTNPDHGYNLPARAEVLSAKFGRTRVDLWRDPEPSIIYRGDPPRPVGVWPERNWRYVVHGVMSGLAATEAVARAKGERTAWENQANVPTRIIDNRIELDPDRMRHQVSAADLAEDARLFQAQCDLVMRLFPADGDPDDIGVRIRPGPQVTARVQAVLLEMGEPLLLRVTRDAEDGNLAELIACALPEGDGRGWAYVLSEPTPVRMGEWEKGLIDLRCLQADLQTIHYVARALDLGSPGTEARLTRIDGPLPEAWLPDSGLTANMLENDNLSGLEEP